MALTREGAVWIAGVGAAALAGTAVWIHQIRGFRRRANQTTGRVVENVEHQSDDGLVYAPRFEFTSQDGVLRSVGSYLRTSPPSFAVGDTVRVLYTSENPDGARIDSFFQLWLGPFVLGILGSVALAFGLIGMLA